MPHFSTFVSEASNFSVWNKIFEFWRQKSVFWVGHFDDNFKHSQVNPKKDRSEGMISRFQECMWKGINSQYIYWIYRLFSSPFKFKKLKEFFLCIRKWCCIVQEIVVVVVLYWFVNGESFKRLSPCLKMGTYWWWWGV